MKIGSIKAIAAAAAFTLLTPAAFAQQKPTYQAAAWEKVLAAAKKEGAVRFYTAALPATTDRIAAGFRKKYPEIAIETFRAAAGQLMPRVDQERLNNSDGADVLISTEVSWYPLRAKENQLVVPIGPAVQQWPAQHVGEGGRYVIGGYELFVIPYNKTAVKTAPTSYADLLKPELAGKLGTIESMSQSLAAWYDWLEKTQGSDYLPKLRAQNPKLYLSGAPIAQAVASGEIAAGVFATVSAVRPMMNVGAPVDFAVPNPAFASIFDVGVLGWSKRPNAALVFMDYVMSMEGQTVWHGTGDSASPLNGVPGAMKTGSLVPFNPENYPPDVVKKYNDRWMRIFK